jgi:hypothetical protein
MSAPSSGEHDLNIAKADQTNGIRFVMRAGADCEAKVTQKAHYCLCYLHTSSLSVAELKRMAAANDVEALHLLGTAQRKSFASCVISDCELVVV